MSHRISTRPRSGCATTAGSTSEQYNLALGRRRAWSAKEYLAARGIDPATMKVISYGKEKPFDIGHDEDAWAKNRRAHVVLTSAK